MSADYSGRGDLLLAAGIVRELLADKDYYAAELTVREMKDEPWHSYQKWAAEQVAVALESEAKVCDAYRRQVPEVLWDFICDMEYCGSMVESAKQAEVFWAAHDEGYGILWHLKDAMELKYEEEEWM